MAMTGGQTPTAITPTFIVEDGTGIENANAYVTVDEYKQYLTDRNRQAEIPKEDDTIQAAIVAATDYIDKTRGEVFRGQRAEGKDYPQSLEFPRINLRNRYGTILRARPKALIHGCIEYATRAITIKLLPDGGITTTGATRQSSVGPIQDSFDTSFVDRTPIVPYPEADLLLDELCFSNGGTIR